jgi:hypothetical protein
MNYRWCYWKRELETNPTRLKSMNFVKNGTYVMKDCAIKVNQAMRVWQMKNMLCLRLRFKGNVAAIVKLVTRLSNANPRRIPMVGQMMESPKLSSVHSVRRQGM